MEKVHATLEEENVAMLTLEQPTLTYVVGKDVVERRESGYGEGMLDRLILGLSHGVRDRRKLSRGSLRRIDGAGCGGEGGHRSGRRLEHG